jgi:hypothetical protein
MEIGTCCVGGLEGCNLFNLFFLGTGIRRESLRSFSGASRARCTWHPFFLFFFPSSSATYFRLMFWGGGFRAGGQGPRITECRSGRNKATNGGQMVSVGMVCVCVGCVLYTHRQQGVRRLKWRWSRLEKGNGWVPCTLSIGRAVWVATPLFLVEWGMMEEGVKTACSRIVSSIRIEGIFRQPKLNLQGTRSRTKRESGCQNPPMMSSPNEDIDDDASARYLFVEYHTEHIPLSSG